MRSVETLQFLLATQATLKLRRHVLQRRSKSLERSTSLLIMLRPIHTRAQHWVGGLRAEGNLGVYNLTKAALIHLTKQLAGELGLTRVVGIAPGLVQTDFAQMLVDNIGDALAKRLPTKRLGVPQDIANLATFLASDLASWMTGETYLIDGGAGVSSGGM